MISFQDTSELKLRGEIWIREAQDPSRVMFHDHNVIVLGVKHFFARMFVSLGEPCWSVWGLALGAGDPSWPSTVQPDATPVQDRIISPLIRKPISKIQFVDENLDPSSTDTNRVSYQTIINATTDNLTAPVREMGLLGGGTKVANGGTGTDPVTAPFWDPTTKDRDSVVLINYKTLPPLMFPAGVNFLVEWVLQF